MVTIWTEDSAESSASTLSLFIDLYQSSGYTVLDYIPEKMKGLDFFIRESVYSLL